VPAAKQTFSGAGKSTDIDGFTPESPKPGGAAVLILHGTYGLLPPYGADIVTFGEGLAKAGIAATLPYYFKRTETTPGPFVEPNTIEMNIETWKTISAMRCRSPQHWPVSTLVGSVCSGSRSERTSHSGSRARGVATPVVP